MNSPDSKPTILIVDDTPINIQVLAGALRADYRVKVAGSGKMALEIITKQGAPDLVLLDVMMPEMDGYAVCRQLKNDPVMQSVPVIFVTAKSDTVDEELGLKLGAVDYIAKPFHLPIVLARIQNHIALKLKSDLLESLAMLDGLTNIPNRRRFDEHLDSEWKRAVQPETAEGGAVQIAERLRESVMNLKIPHAYSPAGAFVTISIGVSSSVPKGDATSVMVQEQADRELYRAKKAGRNRVCVASMTA